MDVRIELNAQGEGCKVWLDDNAVSFAKVDEANAYISQLQARIEAAQGPFSDAVQAAEAH